MTDHPCLHWWLSLCSHGAAAPPASGTCGSQTCAPSGVFRRSCSPCIRCLLHLHMVLFTCRRKGGHIRCLDEAGERHRPGDPFAAHRG